MRHDKISFVREYCLARGIPHRIRGEQLEIKGKPRGYVYSILNFSYGELLEVIDSMVEYDKFGNYVFMCEEEY